MSTSRFKTSSFYLIAVLLPVLLLVIAEWGLRLANSADPHPLFVEVEQMPGFMAPNDKVIQRFFASAEMAPSVSPDTVFFRKVKSDDSIRIVVQGGSTAAGFPFGRWGSLAGMLQQRFKRLYPEKDIEIINTAMASVNSYTLLDFVDEVIDIEPDLVLIYAGHNEYLGVMGVGSAFAAKGGRAATLLYLKLKNLHLYRLIERAYYGLFAAQGTEQVDERTLMAKVAREKDIPYGSELFQLGIEQFEGNMSLILDKYQQAGIPVVLGNLASNEKDQIPFSAVQAITPEMVQQWAEVTKQDSNEERKPEVLTTDDKYSSADWYKLAHHYLANQQPSKALEAFLQAKDRDALRFRAPEAFNQVISNLVQREGVYLADVQGRLRKDTAQGIIGKKYMLEHLHPTARGYFLLADAYLHPIQQLNLLGPALPDSIELAWREMPITKADDLYAQYKIRKLTSDYPFTTERKLVSLPDPASIEGKAVQDRVGGMDWLALNQRLSPLYQRQNDFAEAAKISGLLADALPNNYDLHYVAGLIYKKANNLPLSLFYLHKALRMKPNSITNHLSIAQNYFIMGQADKSMQHLQFVKQHKPDHPNIDGLIQRVQQSLN